MVGRLADALIRCVCLCVIAQYLCGFLSVLCFILILIDGINYIKIQYDVKYK